MNRYFSKEDMLRANKPIEKILNIIIHQEKCKPNLQ